MRNIITILTISVLIAALVGCEKYTSGYDTNPLAPQTANAGKTLIGAEISYVMFTEGFCSILSSIWADQLHGAQRQFSAYDVYTVNGEDFSNDWGLAYSDALKNMQLVENNPAVSQKDKGAAEVLEGLHMGTVTAVWGDVPYSQAGLGLANTTPAYDAQQSVYTAVQAKLSAGITDLTATASGTFEDAFSFNGSSSAWVKLAHSAKARYYMHMASHNGYDAATLATVISEANQGILATDGSDDLMFLHPTGAYNGDMNLWFSFGVYDRSGYMDADGSFAPAMLKAMKDTMRYAFYFDDSQGYTDLNYNDGAAYGAASPYPGFRASETLLLRAEAAQRTSGAAVSAAALADLNSAVTYNNNMFGDATPAYAAPGTGAALLQLILNEEYLAVMHQIEAFNFVRRINYKVNYTDAASVVHSLTPKFGTKFPYRFVYSVDEHNSNPNTPAEAVGALDQFARPWADPSGN